MYEPRIFKGYGAAVYIIVYNCHFSTKNHFSDHLS